MSNPIHLDGIDHTHLWINDGTDIVCTECGVSMPEAQRYQPDDRFDYD